MIRVLTLCVIIITCRARQVAVSKDADAVFKFSHVQGQAGGS